MLGVVIPHCHALIDYKSFNIVLWAMTYFLAFILIPTSPAPESHHYSTVTFSYMFTLYNAYDSFDVMCYGMVLYECKEMEEVKLMSLGGKDNR